MRLEDPTARKIAIFLERIGIPVAIGTAGDSFLPGLAIRDGGLVVDPERLKWPSDMLHEAGHIAVAEPSLRNSLNDAGDDPGEEMAAIAWSYAAAVEIGIDPAALFHEDYKGGGAALAENFSAGRDVGVPMLRWFGMTAGWGRTAEPGRPPFPHMARWLR